MDIKQKYVNECGYAVLRTIIELLGITTEATFHYVCFARAGESVYYRSYGSDVFVIIDVTQNTKIRQPDWLANFFANKSHC